MKESHKISTVQVMELFGKFGRPLMEILNFKDVHCLVFFYLFAGKVYANDPWHCAYDIFKSLREPVTPIPLFKRRRGVSEKNVSKTLDDLVACGWVSRESIKSIKFRERFKRAGRPPTCVYGVKSIPEIMERIMKEIEDKKRRLMEVLSPLSAIEEAAEKTM